MEKKATPCFPAYLVPWDGEVGSNPQLEEEHSKAWENYCKTHSVEDVVLGDWETDIVIDQPTPFGTFVANRKHTVVEVKIEPKNNQETEDMKKEKQILC